MQKIKTILTQKTNRIASIAFLGIFVLMSMMCSTYYQRLQSTVKDESYEYLQEIAKQVASNVSQSMSDNFSVLDTVATVLKSSQVSTYKDLQPVVLSQQNTWGFESLLLIDNEGNAMDANGGATLLSGDSSIRDSVVNRTRTMSSSQMINGSECILFINPVDGLSIEGKPISAIAATYALSDFDKILSLDAFSGYGFAHIINKNGSTVIRSSSVHAQKSGYNILNTLDGVKFDDAMSGKKIRQAISARISGAATYSMDGNKMYVVYSPLETEEWYLLGFVPVSVVSGKSILLIRMTLLLCATITLAFALLFAYVINSNMRNKRKLEVIVYVDPITGGNTIQRFYEHSKHFLTTANNAQYALVYSNIEKFKIMNEEFGELACNDTLICIHDAIRQNLSQNESIGRVSADNFCMLVEYNDKDALEHRLETWLDEAINLRRSKGGIWLSPVMSFGIYVISNTSMSLPQMVDRAKLALREQTTKLRSKLQYAMYDDGIHRRLLREKHLEDMMEAGLKSREFEVYLQPKYNTITETIGGAEALVRWNSVSEGMIYPDEFISLFEKNGFIIQLDLWVFEQVCHSLHKWIDAGKEPVKISVNCSRIHLKNPIFLNYYVDICNSIGIPKKYIEIELTENMVFEDVAHLSKIINDIHDAGFGCSMDDFGSGYSSLNLIQDIPVDTIKLDKVFFRRHTASVERMESVVGSIVNMSHSLHMHTVAEGVEERTQVDMLKRLNCDLIQGYYFAKPMPIVQFEELAFGAPVGILPNDFMPLDTENAPSVE